MAGLREALNALDMARTVDIRTEIEIERPRADVAAYSSDPDNVTAWYENIERVDWVTPPPLVVGSQIAFFARFLGRSLSYTYVIRELVPDERLVMSTSDGPFPMETSYTWSETAASTTIMALRNRGEPSGFAKVTTRVMESAIQRANRKDLERLKVILETGRSSDRMED